MRKNNLFCCLVVFWGETQVTREKSFSRGSCHFFWNIFHLIWVGSSFWKVDFLGGKHCEKMPIPGVGNNMFLLARGWYMKKLPRTVVETFRRQPEGLWGDPNGQSAWFSQRYMFNMSLKMRKLPLESLDPSQNKGQVVLWVFPTLCQHDLAYSDLLGCFLVAVGRDLGCRIVVCLHIQIASFLLQLDFCHYRWDGDFFRSWQSFRQLCLEVSIKIPLNNGRSLDPKNEKWQTSPTTIHGGVKQEWHSFQRHPKQPPGIYFQPCKWW